MTSPPTAVMTEQDADHLRLLSIFHYVVGVMQGLVGCFPIVHFLMGAAMVFMPEKLWDAKNGPPPVLFGWFFMLFAGAWMTFAWTLAVCLVIAGRSLSQRKRYLFCLVTAGVAAVVCVPLGTVLGVLTILVLLRPAVKAAFEAGHE